MTEHDERPPVFRTWYHWYGLVILTLACVIAGLYIFSAHFS